MSTGFLLTALLGGILALLIALIVGEGPRTDGFFTAYSVFLFFSLFGSSLRVAVVPLLGSTADEAAWRRRAREVLCRLTAVAALFSLLVAVLAALLAPGGGTPPPPAPRRPAWRCWPSPPTARSRPRGWPRRWPRRDASR